MESVRASRRTPQGAVTNRMSFEERRVSIGWGSEPSEPDSAVCHFRGAEGRVGPRPRTPGIRFLFGGMEDEPARQAQYHR